MEAIIDCALTREEALAGTDIPADMYNTQELVNTAAPWQRVSERRSV